MMRTSDLFNLVENIRKQIHPISPQISSLSNFSSLFNAVKENEKFFNEINSLSKDEYEKRFCKKVERAEALGKHGWVIGQHMQMGIEDKVLARFNNGESEESVVTEFLGNRDISDIEIDLLKQTYQNTNLVFYLEQFAAVYKNQDYTSAAYYLCAILERRTRIFVNTYRNLTKLIEKGVSEEKENYFATISANRSQGALDLFVLTEYIPSLKTFLERVFEDGIYTFENGIEPPYFNRNWLVHGMLSKPVKKYQVLQIYNALDTLEVIIEAKNKLSKS